jgi:hypothetical protein
MKSTYISLLISALSLGWGVWNYRRAKAAEARLDDQRRSHFRAVDEAREQVTTLESEVRTLRQQVRALSGEGNLFEPDTTIAEAIALHPRAAEVFQSFHIGGCSSCAVDSEDTIRYAAGANNQDVDLLLQSLNKLTSGGEAEVLHMIERKPNVQITL